MPSRSPLRKLLTTTLKSLMSLPLQDNRMEIYEIGELSLDF